MCWSASCRGTRLLMLLILTCGSLGCFTWVTVGEILPNNPEEADPDLMVRVTTKEQRAIDLRKPWVGGGVIGGESVPSALEGPPYAIEVPIEDVDRVEERVFDGGKTIRLITPVLAILVWALEFWPE